jgi:hypothetical protein
MSTKLSLPELPTRIQKLLEERRHHTDALARIDMILAGIGAALGGTTVKTPVVKAAKAPAAKAPAATGKKRKLKRFAVSAEQSILNFVKEHKNPTSQEIGKHYQGEGRGGRADNTLSLMVKNKKLKRTPLGKGTRGSRYSLV